MTAWFYAVPWPALIATLASWAVVTLWATGRLARALAKPPAGPGDAAPAPQAPRPARPGQTIPPPPVTHAGRVLRRADIIDCGCVWVWRGHQRGWHLDHQCVPVPTADQWDWWLQTLSEGDK